MKSLTLIASTLVVFASSAFAGAGDFEIKKVDVSFPSSPQFATDQPQKLVKPLKWMAIDVSFDAKPEFTDEVTLNYYVLFAKRLFVGHVTHVAVVRGRDLHSVAYMAPKDLVRILQGRQMGQNDLDNISVTITAPGKDEVISTKSAKPCNGAWWTTMKQEDGHVLNKSETPFASLYWDYYEAVKPSSSR